MSMLTTALAFTATFIRTYLHEISFGITAVTLILFGPYINRSIHRLVKKFNWFLRYVVFVLLCTAGYTFLTQIIYHGVKNLLAGSSNLPLVVLTAGIYLVLAGVAKEHKAI